MNTVTNRKRSVLALMITLMTSALAFATTPDAKKATAITQVVGGGVRLVAVAMEYGEALSGSDFTTTDFTVEGRTISEIFASHSVSLTDRADRGKYIILHLSSNDNDVPLSYKVTMSNATTSSTPKKRRQKMGGWR